MLRRLRKLLAHPAFRAEPAAVMLRAIAWSACVAMRRSPVFCLTSGGERLRLPADLRYTSVTSFILRDWTEPELRELSQFVQPGEVFIDVGANVGLYTLKAARLVGARGMVVAIEPGQISADRLEQNLALNDFANVRIVRAALAEKIGTAALYHVALGDDPQAFSLLTDGSTTEAETVATTTLDTVVEALDLPRVDCLKIDVEGAEPLVLAGGRATLERWHPTVIFEVNAPLSLKSSSGREAAWRLLETFGYRFYRLDAGSLAPLDRMPHEFGNLIAICPARSPAEPAEPLNGPAARRPAAAAPADLAAAVPPVR